MSHQVSKGELIAVACRTYNACTRYIKEKFGLIVSVGSPQERFQTVVDHLYSLMTTTRQERQERIEQYSKEQIRAIFLIVGVRCFEKAYRQGGRETISREDFVRQVIQLMSANFGFCGGERLHTHARTGLYRDLSRNFPFLFKQMKDHLSYRGSRATDELIFTSR